MAGIGCRTNHEPGDLSLRYPRCQALRLSQEVAAYMRVGTRLNSVLLAAALIVAWGWALLAGIGGLILLLHEGPLPITNGWFAMLSGVAACPLTGSLLRRYVGVTVPNWIQLAIALFIFIAGRIAVVVLLHRPFLPQCTGDCW